MFGYIRTRPGELLVREDTYYRAAYCGLCRSHGTCTGQCSRCFLSYDFTFLSIVRSVLAGETEVPEWRRCALHPTQKRMMLRPSPAMKDMAYAAAILNAYKNLDDLRDERGGKRFRAILMRPFLSGGKRRAEKQCPGMAEGIRKGLDELSRLEEQKIVSVDVYAEVFGRMIADVLCYGLDGANARIAKTIGFHLGKWIYLIDAVDDFPEDVRKKRFNPFVLLYGTDRLTDQHITEIRIALSAELMGAENGFDLLTYPGGDRDERQGIIRNIIYLGMPDVAERILGRYEGEEKEVEKSEGSV